MATSQADLAELNRTFDNRSPQELLLWAREIFGDRIAVLTSMQEAGNVVCHMLHSIPVPMPVVFVDTGVLFQETLDTRDRLAREYGLTIHTLTPTLTMQQQTEQLGILYLTPEGQKQCCEMREKRTARQSSRTVRRHDRQSASSRWWSPWFLPHPRC